MPTPSSRRPRHAASEPVRIAGAACLVRDGFIVSATSVRAPNDDAQLVGPGGSATSPAGLIWDADLGGDKPWRISPGGLDLSKHRT